MRRNFDFKEAIYLSLPPHKFDLHNIYDFSSFEYSIEKRTLKLEWNLGEGDRVLKDCPQRITISFNEVSEFRFRPRDTSLPFTEDICVHALGFVTDEDWAEGVVTIDTDCQPQSDWLMAIEFRSGAIIAVQSASAHAETA